MLSGHSDQTASSEPRQSHLARRWGRNSQSTQNTERSQPQALPLPPACPVSPTLGERTLVTGGAYRMQLWGRWPLSTMALAAPKGDRVHWTLKPGAGGA